MRVFILLLLLSLSLLSSCQNCSATSESACLRCRNSVFFDGRCMPCESAKTEYSCELCKGYYFKEGQCLPCRELTNPSQCQECRGFFFAQGTCSPCELAPPYLCNLQCPDYFLKRGICTHCGKAGDEMTCRLCLSPFEFKNGKCLQCPKHYTTSLLDYECMSCAGLNNQLLCRACQQFFFANSTCQACVNATTASACSHCPDFFFNGTTCRHCNSAGEIDCAFCRNHIFSNGFCVPCRLVGEANSCKDCLMFRYSTDRQMCVPCQKKGYFLSENNTCQHCLSAKSEENCIFCHGFAFDQKNRVCMNCSEIVEAKKCTNCMDFYYSDSKMKCIPCANAAVLDCLVQCPGFFYKRKCTNCLEAATREDCKSCGSTYYWSSSGKCSICLANDFFVSNNECIPCSKANQTQCEMCSLYFFSGSQCTPCKLAKNNEECSKCTVLIFYFSPRETCQACPLASSAECSQQNCPGFAYSQGSCRRASTIASQAACVKYPFFSYTRMGCQYCGRSNEYLNPVSYQCSRCDSFKNSTECSRCQGYYYNTLNSSCTSCSTITNRTQCSQCISHYFVNSQCVPCVDLTRERDCLQCQGFLYRQGDCVKCAEAVNAQECRGCQYHAFEQDKCKRCEAISDMDVCEIRCNPQGYYAIRRIGICASCASATSQNDCTLCPHHSWDNNTQRCVNCNDSSTVCLSCPGKYWSSNYCRPCATRFCGACSSDGKTCTQCRPSYVLSANFLCVKQCNAKYCRKCTEGSSEVCSECLPDYSFTSSKGECRLECLVARCAVCTSNSQCLTCQEGFTLKSDKTACVCSIANCDSCQIISSPQGNTSKCNRCVTGFSYNSTNNNCSKIECNRANCMTCRNESACETCMRGWKIDTYRVCTPICTIAGCSLCSSISTCQACMQGYKQQGDKECEPVCGIANCARCKTNSSCERCLQYYFTSKDGLKCERKCPLGQYLSKGSCGYCEGIVKNCDKCRYEEQVVKCSKCQPSFVYAYDECTSCTFFSPYCIDCQLTSNVFECNTCATGYSLLGRRCRKCADNCVSCTRNGQDDCDECIKGYVYNSASVNSIKCVHCLENCATCSQTNISSCLSCFPGQFLRDGTCSKCPQNCRNCAEADACFECMPGYFWENSLCYKQEIPSCKEYYLQDGQPSCLACAQGFEVANDRKSCTPSKCSLSSSCLVCPKAQFLSSGKCFNCSQANCDRCSDKDNLCTKCSPGYYLQADSRCLKCMQGCAICNSKYQCKQQAEGYFLESNVSLPARCLPQCTSCANHFCYSCKKGYTLYKFKCISEQALRMTITVKPKSNEWNGLSPALRFKNLMTSWTLYHDELLKLIGYENMEELVFVDKVSTGSITYYLVIDILSTEDVKKAIEEIEQALVKENKVFSVLYRNIFTNPKTKISNDHPASSASEQKTDKYIFIGLTALFGTISCVFFVLRLREFLIKRRRVSNEQGEETKGKLNRECMRKEGSQNSDETADAKEQESKQRVSEKESIVE